MDIFKGQNEDNLFLILARAFGNYNIYIYIQYHKNVPVQYSILERC